jgi:hypothetical protein
VKESEKKLAPVISLKKKKRRKRAKKAIIGVLPDKRQIVIVRPLTGDAKKRYAEWKKKHKED